VEAILIAQGGASILPLAIVEGPLVSIVAGFLVARGDFHWYWVLFLLICGDTIGDVIYYGIGRGGGRPLAGLARLAGSRRAFSPEIQQRLKENATRMLFIGKWTHSIGGVVLVGSGMLRVPLARFVLANLIATIPKSAILLAAGYFAGQNYPLLERHAILVTIVLCAIGISAMLPILRRSGLIPARHRAEMAEGTNEKAPNDIRPPRTAR
jgi:membrane protein DedA with SNARE-associated domain